ncbi:BZ3500_MvSof-1268-A1-R1_Chr1-2g01308 [Microbotryum saponariae]|uniref:BZ3500_MvSof-1268-A1-R1_Chr1-2g01308 protein n=1 Tax=Microbotryum saponariae TaxID=289078 RepID=A0A2X0MI57_9BASI|nr:BZ3500_MvSof-1268-A1-R1_Chr1-2g01308 [Microbotryum saponariae]SCZ97045.1 BZ3501_MvSof-1269-A2-R1_Chr1-2g00907 [Microbotryum saponariae]
MRIDVDAGPSDGSQRHRKDRRKSGGGSSSGRHHRSSRHRDETESEREERRRRKKEKRDKKDKKDKKDRKKKGLATIEWGKHGILTETDIYQKDQEFRAWLVGERMLNPETMSKAKEKEIFKEFMEDFNTGTLPHEKYYNMDK